MLITQFVLGTLMVCLTVLIHAIFMDRMHMLLRRQGPHLLQRFHLLWKIPFLLIAVMGVFSILIVEVWLWAGMYLWLQALPDFESSLYFSTVTFSTLGYGDLVLDRNWRLLSSFQAANGMLLFGWSTAFIFEVMNKLYERDFVRRKLKDVDDLYKNM